jgi:hypothetical protein
MVGKGLPVTSENTATARAPRSSGPPAPAELQLQRAIGNRNTARLLREGNEQAAQASSARVISPAQRRVLARNSFAQQQERLREFISRGPYEGEYAATHLGVPARFHTAYDPRRQELRITFRLAWQFIGDSPGTELLAPSVPGGPFSVRRLPPQPWTRAEQDSEVRRIENEVQRYWSGRITFFNQTPYWDLRARVVINFENQDNVVRGVDTFHNTHYLMIVRRSADVRPHVVPPGDEPGEVDLGARSGSSESQPAHEFGHMVGLGDEYVSDDEGHHVEDPVEHSPLVEGLRGRPEGMTPGTRVPRANDDRLMSTGNRLDEDHAITFLWALDQVTFQTPGQYWAYHPNPTIASQRGASAITSPVAPLPEATH